MIPKRATGETAGQPNEQDNQPGGYSNIALVKGPSITPLGRFLNKQQVASLYHVYIPPVMESWCSAMDKLVSI